MSIMIGGSQNSSETEIEEKQSVYQSVYDESVFNTAQAPIDKDDINKQMIMQLKCNLHNIARCLQVIFH